MAKKRKIIKTKPRIEPKNLLSNLFTTNRMNERTIGDISSIILSYLSPEDLIRFAYMWRVSGFYFIPIVCETINLNNDTLPNMLRRCWSEGFNSAILTKEFSLFIRSNKIYISAPRDICSRLEKLIFNTDTTNTVKIITPPQPSHLSIKRKSGIERSIKNAQGQILDPQQYDFLFLCINHVTKNFDKVVNDKDNKEIYKIFIKSAYNQLEKLPAIYDHIKIYIPDLRHSFMQPMPGERMPLEIYFSICEKLYKSTIIPNNNNIPALKKLNLGIPVKEFYHLPNSLELIINAKNELLFYGQTKPIHFFHPPQNTAKVMQISGSHLLIPSGKVFKFKFVNRYLKLSSASLFEPARNLKIKKILISSNRGIGFCCMALTESGEVYASKKPNHSVKKCNIPKQAGLIIDIAIDNNLLVALTEKGYLYVRGGLETSDDQGKSLYDYSSRFKKFDNIPKNPTIKNITIKNHKIFALDKEGKVHVIGHLRLLRQSHMRFYDNARIIPVNEIKFPVNVKIKQISLNHDETILYAIGINSKTEKTEIFILRSDQRDQNNPPNMSRRYCLPIEKLISVEQYIEYLAKKCGFTPEILNNLKKIRRDIYGPLPEIQNSQK